MKKGLDVHHLALYKREKNKNKELCRRLPGFSSEIASSEDGGKNESLPIGSSAEGLLEKVLDSCRRPAVCQQLVPKSENMQRGDALAIEDVNPIEMTP